MKSLARECTSDGVDSNCYEAQTRKSVCRTLGMVTPAVVLEVPNRPNIKYVVCASPGTLEEAFAPLVEEIRWKRTNIDRVIIYC